MTPGPETDFRTNGTARATGAWDMTLSFVEACVFRHVHTPLLELSGFANGAKKEAPGVATGTRQILLLCRCCYLAIILIRACCVLGAA